MTIDEAIRVNTAVENYEIGPWMPQALEAQKLGNEALKRIQRQRRDLSQAEMRPLPGETDE